MTERRHSERPSGSPANPFAVKVHEPGEARLDAVLRMSAEATARRPLPTVMQSLCRSVTEAGRADIVSLYRRERHHDEDVLVMRANVGFPPGAVDNVRLRLGEGITGFAAECMRPVSTPRASTDRHFKAVPGLGEERFPVFLAIPLIERGATVAVMVIQRGGPDFDPQEIAFFSALSMAFAAAMQASARRESETASVPSSQSSRTVRLSASSLVPGVALGRARPLPSVSELAVEADVDATLAAFDAVRKELRKEITRVRETLGAAEKAEVSTLELLLSDARLRSALEDACEQKGTAAALEEVARDYALTAYRVGADEAVGTWLVARAAEVAGLCLLVAARLAGRAIAAAGDALLMPQAPSAFVALHVAARRVSAVVVGSEIPPQSMAITLLRADGITTVAEVAGLFDWIRPDDPLCIDADAGAVFLHPTPAQIAKVRSRGRGEPAP